MIVKWDATEHAKGRIVERFRVAETGVLDWLNNRMQTAEYVTNAPDAQGKMRRVFIGKGVVFHASLTENVIYTVVPAQRRTEWAETLQKVAEKEIRKFNTKAIAEERELLTRRSDMESRIVDIKGAMLSARSSARKTNLLAQYNEMNAELAEIERNLVENRRSVVRMAESFYAAM